MFPGSGVCCFLEFEGPGFNCSWVCVCVCVFPWRGFLVWVCCVGGKDGFICVYIFYIYIYIHIHNIYMHIDIYMYMYMNIYLYIYTYIYVYIEAYTYTYKHINTYMYVHSSLMFLTLSIHGLSICLSLCFVTTKLPAKRRTYPSDTACMEYMDHLPLQLDCVGGFVRGFMRRVGFKHAQNCGVP